MEPIYEVNVTREHILKADFEAGCACGIACAMREMLQSGERFETDLRDFYLHNGGKRFGEWPKSLTDWQDTAGAFQVMDRALSEEDDIPRWQYAGYDSATDYVEDGWGGSTICLDEYTPVWRHTYPEASFMLEWDPELDEYVVSDVTIGGVVVNG